MRSRSARRRPASSPTRQTRLRAWRREPFPAGQSGVAGGRSRRVARGCGREVRRGRGRTARAVDVTPEDGGWRGDDRRPRLAHVDGPRRRPLVAARPRAVGGAAAIGTQLRCRLRARRRRRVACPRERRDGPGGAEDARPSGSGGRVRADAVDGRVVAPMPGRVVKVLVTPGTRVEARQASGGGRGDENGERAARAHRRHGPRGAGGRGRLGRSPDRARRDRIACPDRS